MRVNMHTATPDILTIKVNSLQMHKSNSVQQTPQVTDKIVNIYTITLRWPRLRETHSHNRLTQYETRPNLVRLNLSKVENDRISDEVESLTIESVTVELLTV